MIPQGHRHPNHPGHQGHHGHPGQQKGFTTVVYQPASLHDVDAPNMVISSFYTIILMIRLKSHNNSEKYLFLHQ